MDTPDLAFLPLGEHPQESGSAAQRRVSMKTVQVVSRITAKPLKGLCVRQQ